MANPNDKGTGGATNQGQGSQGQARNVADQARGMAGDVAGRVQDAASSAAGRAQDMASQAAQAARDAAGMARGHVEGGVHSMGAGMRSAASGLRENAPHGGMMGSAAASLADTLERGGSYLEQDGLGNLTGDLTDMIRRNPLPAVLIGVGVGFLLAQMLSSRSDR